MQRSVTRCRLQGSKQGLAPVSRVVDHERDFVRIERLERLVEPVYLDPLLYEVLISQLFVRRFLSLEVQNPRVIPDSEKAVRLPERENATRGHRGSGTDERSTREHVLGSALAMERVLSNRWGDVEQASECGEGFHSTTSSVRSYTDAHHGSPPYRQVAVCST